MPPRGVVSGAACWITIFCPAPACRLPRFRLHVSLFPTPRNKRQRPSYVMLLCYAALPGSNYDRDLRWHKQIQARTPASSLIVLKPPTAASSRDHPKEKEGVVRGVGGVGGEFINN